MGVHSVSCWSLSDKVPVLLAPGDPTIRALPQPRTHPVPIVSHDVGVPGLLSPRQTSARDIRDSRTPLRRSCLETGVRRKHLTGIWILDSANSASLATQVLTFGRSAAHFRENQNGWRPALALDRRLKTQPNRPVTSFKSTVDIGAHLRENRCSLTGEVPLTFGRSLLTFGRTGAHFREKCRSLSGEQVLTFGRTKFVHGLRINKLCALDSLDSV
jgi:hypothetical protein